MGTNGPVPTRPASKQHGHQTLGRQHPPSRGEESESNYLNCPGGPGSRESQQWTVEGKWPGRSGSGSSCCQTSNFLSTPSAYIYPERLPWHGTPHTDCRTQAEDTRPAIQTDPTGLLSYRALQVKGSSHSSGLMGDKSLSHSTAPDQKVKAIQPWK